ncbi:MAG: HEAT repeat domain-containing protein [Planctomycetaceae bacterium]|nr:HEAT repeat domain-containing protein [Planctomycetaceae bacterium]
MTGCYATDRRSAIHKLGDRYDGCCHPEIMNAFVYALNDADERVRAKAADEIGDQVRRNRCVCGPPVICALQQALGDCDPNVRRQAWEALHWSGHDVVSGTCCQNGTCDDGVWATTNNAAGPVTRTETAAMTVPAAETELISVPPERDAAAPSYQSEPFTSGSEIPESVPAEASPTAEPASGSPERTVSQETRGPVSRTFHAIRSFVIENPGN